MRKMGSERSYPVSTEDREWPRAKKCECPLAAGKKARKQILLKNLRRNAALPIPQF